jgi:hypothetical protein
MVLASINVMCTVPCKAFERYDAVIQPAVPPPRTTIRLMRLSCGELALLSMSLPPRLDLHKIENAAAAMVRESGALP